MASRIDPASGFHYVNVPSVEMRQTADLFSMIVSQAYFSERVYLHPEAGEVNGRIMIETAVDRYPGWVDKGAIFCRESSYPSVNASTVVKIHGLAAHLYREKDTIYGPLLTLPFESWLEVLDSSDPRWIEVILPDARKAYVQRGTVTIDPPLLKLEQVCDLSLFFLNSPYLWGGRSSFGYDCAGFIQMLYRQMGVYIPRDAKDQIHWEGFIPVEMLALKRGDLVFWGYAEGEIAHVGMFLGGEVKDGFIHSSVQEDLPYIRLSRLSDPEWRGEGLYPYFAARTLKDSN